MGGVGVTDSADVSATFGPYQIRQLLASGRIASVFEAVGGEGETRREVALKVFAGRVRIGVELSPGTARQAGVPGIRVRHPAVVQIYEIGRVGENLFVAMERVDGPTLEQLVSTARDGMLPIERPLIVYLAVQIAEGLRAIHVAEVEGTPLDAVHGDLRPSNVLVSRAGQPKVAGWGTEAVIRAYSDLDEPARPLDPPLYVSPEQTRGEELTPASDVFSWGTVVLELIAGKPLFDTPTTRGSIRKLRGAQVKGPLEVAGKSFPELVPILEKALHKDPARRYHDGEELAAALREITPTKGARDLLALLIEDVRGVIPDEVDDEDELVERVSHASADDEGQPYSSFVLPPSDPIAAEQRHGATPLRPEEESLGGTDTDDLTATDEIGETEELLDAATSSSARREPALDSLEAQATTARTAAPTGDEDTAGQDAQRAPAAGGAGDDSPGEPDTEDGEGDEREPDATETLRGEGVQAERQLAADMEISAFNPPRTFDDELESTVPPAGTDGGEADDDDEPPEESTDDGEGGGPVRSTRRAFPGGPAPRQSARRSPEKVTVWTGTSGRPETFTAGAAEARSGGARWLWIAISVAAVALLAVLIVSEFTPSRRGGDAAAAGTTGGGGAGMSSTVGAGQGGGQAGTAGSTDAGAGDLGAAPDAAPDAGTEDGEAATGAPLLDPSILGDAPPRPEEEDEALTPIAENLEDGAVGAEPSTPLPSLRVTHSPVSRGIRGRPISLSVSVDPPGSYQAVIWYRAAGGPWQQSGARGGDSGTISGSIPHGAWLGDDAKEVDYYIEVVGDGVTGLAGSAVSPHRVKIY